LIFANAGLKWMAQEQEANKYWPKQPKDLRGCLKSRIWQLKLVRVGKR
jgi:hypothetical protein